MYRLIAVDIDGTLLGSEGRISERTFRVLSGCMATGINVTISTGRAYQGAVKLARQLKLDMPIITYNGSMIVDTSNDRRIYEKELLAEDAEQIIKLGLERDTTMVIWSCNQLYVNRIDDFVTDYRQMSGNDPIVVDDYGHVLAQGITKIIWIDNNNRIRQFAAEVEGNVKDSVTFCTSKPIFLEFFNNEASKGNALKILAESYGISRDEVIAIGDGENDIPMIDYAGLGIAMDNADKRTKERADYITSSCDNDGIAEALEKFVLTYKQPH